MHIDYGRLRRRGWTESEIAHAKTVFVGAEAKKAPGVVLLEQALAWLLFLLGITGAAALLLLLFPFLILGDIVVAVAVLFLAGVVLGLLLVAGVRSLHMHPRHHVPGVSMLFLICLGVSTIIIALIQQGMPGAHNPVLLAAALSIGLIIPYLLERRLHGTA